MALYRLTYKGINNIYKDNISFSIVKEHLKGTPADIFDVYKM